MFFVPIFHPLDQGVEYLNEEQYSVDGLNPDQKCALELASQLELCQAVLASILTCGLFPAVGVNPDWGYNSQHRTSAIRIAFVRLGLGLGLGLTQCK
jgi:hypothetical protein